MVTPLLAPACLQVTVELKLGLPQVAVVGSQSSGKSSVLEALVSSSVYC
jgi:ribosome-interacting GTPase 1